MRYFLYLAYMGKAYSGWQIQKNAHSVQQVVEEVLSRLFQEKIVLVGSSRTDRGVHAKQQVAHVDLLPCICLANLAYRLNRMLPADIAVEAIRPVAQDAHARFHASYRKYAYTIRAHKNPRYMDSTLWMHTLPSCKLLNQAAGFFCTKADFSNFSKALHPRKSPICKIEECYWIECKDKITFYVKANRFLHGMVRAMVGAMLQVANGKMTFNQLRSLILGGSAAASTPTLVPAHGLTLVEVGYPEKLFLEENVR